MFERRGDARAYLTLAEQLAREVGDTAALGLTLMLHADLLSAIPAGGQDGFPEAARRLLEEGVATTSPATPMSMRAPLLLRSAEEHAYVGLETETLRYLDDAQRVTANSGIHH